MPAHATIRAWADADPAAADRRVPAAIDASRCAAEVFLEHITRGRKPLVVLPPNGIARAPIARILTPLEGTKQSSEAIADTLAFADRRALEILLHVHTAATLPPFGDQPQHEVAAWQREFVSRFVALPHAGVRMFERIADVGLCVLAEAAEAGGGARTAAHAAVGHGG